MAVAIGHLARDLPTATLRPKEGRFVWRTNTPALRNSGFEVTSKRRKGYPSETHVKRGARIVHGDKELIEKLGRNDPCPCGSGKCF